MHFIILLDIDNDSVTLFILADQQKKKKKKKIAGRIWLADRWLPILVVGVFNFLLAVQNALLAFHFKSSANENLCYIHKVIV